MPVHPIQQLIEDYLEDRIGLADAAATAHSIMAAEGMMLASNDPDPKTQAKLKALIARLLWLGLKAQGSDVVPEEPFTAEQMRVFIEDFDPSA